MESKSVDAIYNKYIKRKSKYRINISSSIVKKLTKIFSKKDKSKISFAHDVFDEAR